MSISNFSQKRSPNEEFLQSLEKEINLQAITTIKSFDNLDGAELAKAKLKLAFDLEQLRLQRIVKYCDSEEYRAFLRAERANPNIVCLDRKWQNTTVFEKKLIFKHASNSEIANKRKSEMVPASFKKFLQSRNSVQYNNNNAAIRKSICEHLDLGKMTTSKVIGLGLPLTGTKKSRDYSAFPDNEFESIESRPNPFGVEHSSEEDLANSMHSGSEESDVELETESPCGVPTDVPVLTIVKQNRFIVDFNGSIIRCISNKFTGKPTGASFEKSETHRFSRLDSDGMLSWLYYGGKAIKLATIPNSAVTCASVPSEDIQKVAQGQLGNSVTIRNSENFFKDQNCGSFQKYNSLQGGNDRICYNSHNFNNSLRCYASLGERECTRLPGNKVTLAFNTPEHFSVNVNEGQYGAFVNLPLDGFSQKLLLEEGMMFLINEKKGFGVQTIISGSESGRRGELLRTALADERFYMHCANLRQSALPGFIAQLKLVHPESQDPSIDWNKNSALNSAFKAFFIPLLMNSANPIIVLSKVEYHQQYKLFQWKEKAIVFQIDLSGTVFEPFFQKVDCRYSDFDMGETLVKHQEEVKIRNPVTTFFAPYDLHFSYHPEVERFSLSYPGKEVYEFCDLWDIAKCGLKWTGDWQGKAGAKPLTQEKLIRNEGLWVGLTKMDFYEEGMSSKTPVNLPFGSVLMINQIVYLVSQTNVLLSAEEQQ